MQKEESLKKQHIKKADIVLIVICLFWGLLLGLWFLFGQQTGTVIRISYDGTELYRITLENYKSSVSDGTPTEENSGSYYLITYSDNDTPKITETATRPECPTDTSYNLLYLIDGKVRIEEADCKDQICVRHKAISGIHESIICLPHKLVIEISGDGTDTIQDTDTLDGMVK